LIDNSLPDVFFPPILSLRLHILSPAGQEPYFILTLDGKQPEIKYPEQNHLKFQTWNRPGPKKQNPRMSAAGRAALLPWDRSNLAQIRAKFNKFIEKGDFDPERKTAERAAVFHDTSAQVLHHLLFLFIEAFKPSSGTVFKSKTFRFQRSFIDGLICHSGISFFPAT